MEKFKNGDFIIDSYNNIKRLYKYDGNNGYYMMAQRVGNREPILKEKLTNVIKISDNAKIATPYEIKELLIKFAEAKGFFLRSKFTYKSPSNDTLIMNGSVDINMELNKFGNTIRLVAGNGIIYNDATGYWAELINGNYSVENQKIIDDYEIF